MDNFALDYDVACLFSSRGVNDNNADQFFFFDEENFFDPFLMKNMNEAVDYIKNIMVSDKKILIYGDYDADGLTSSSILKLFFNNNGIDCDVLIPTRDEGYGLHIDNVMEMFQNKHYDLILTVDCGISNKDEIDFLKEKLNTAVIVTDHHELPPVLPNCICVNPKLGYPFAMLSGSGVAFKLVQALSDLDNATNYADLAMIGTIADMMPLESENRDIVRLGLQNFHHKGLIKIAEKCNCTKPYNSFDMALRVAPKINAAGRVGSPLTAYNILLMQQKADEKAVEELLSVNEQRKSILEKVTLEAEILLHKSNFMNDKLIFLAGEDWGKGILGIAANRYRETYNLPTVFLTKDGENYVGSARGIDSINLYDIFNSISNCLIRFGGHKSSVGFSVSIENLNLLKQSLINEIAKQPSECFDLVSYYDLDYNDKYLSQEFLDCMDVLQPLLPSDKVVYYANDTCKIASLFGSDKKHIRIVLNNGLELKGFFKYYQYFDALNSGALCEILFSLEYDIYAKRNVGIISQIQIVNSLHFDKLYAQNLISNLTDMTIDNTFIDLNMLKDIVKKDNTLLIFASYIDFENMEKVVDLSQFQVSFFKQDCVYDKSVIISPIDNENFDTYNNVVVFGRYSALVASYNCDCVYFDYINNSPTFFDFEINRDVCISAYKALISPVRYVSLQAIYDSKLSQTISYEQFLVAKRVFEQLNLIKIETPFAITILLSDKLKLEESSLYRYFNTDRKKPNSN